MEALLDQRNLAGIGNLWAVETCYLRGVSPWTPVREVDLRAAVRLARRMMRHSLEHPGQVTTGDTRRGRTHWVYGRAERPCRRCATPVAFRDGGPGPYERETWWCPHCQPGPFPTLEQRPTRPGLRRGVNEESFGSRTRRMSGRPGYARPRGVPEGDTVWLAGQRLHEALAGDVLVRSDFRVPALATVDLAGRRVLEVVPRGKHLLTRLSDGLTLHTHFRMDGSWHLYRPGDRWTGGPQWQVRAVLETASVQAVGYRLPVVELLATDDEDTVVGHLGPDVLGPDWDAEEAVRRLSADAGRRGRAWRCSTSATWRGSATSTAARCCSCRGSRRGCGSPTCPTWRRSSTRAGG